MNDKNIAISRSLRHRPTDAERLLWGKLRNKQLDGFLFRRQHPIGGYVADFVCLKKKLVVEVDGGHHASESNEEADTKRTKWFEAQGYRVVRVWNNEVVGNTEGVVDMIRECLAEVSPLPFVPPSRERDDLAYAGSPLPPE